MGWKQHHDGEQFPSQVWVLQEPGKASCAAMRLNSLHRTAHTQLRGEQTFVSVMVSGEFNLGTPTGLERASLVVQLVKNPPAMQET